LETIQKSLRYERKFFIRNINTNTIESIVRDNPVGFSEIYHQRWVNNIYFDYLDLRNFRDNIDGNVSRVKYRLRWYGDLWDMINKPKLEIKIKNGMVGIKKLIDLNDFKLKIGVDANLIKNVVNTAIPKDQILKFSLNEQYPVMLNRYRRKYFQSFNRKFRLTIDDTQSFYKFNKFNNTFLEKIEDIDNTIMEIKYAKEDDAQVSKITNNFPFRLTKSSKYARGMEMFYY